MLARVVFPLHGFGGIERHVFHLVTHLARLGVQVTLYVQEPRTENRVPSRRTEQKACPEARRREQRTTIVLPLDTLGTHRAEGNNEQLQRRNMRPASRDLRPVTVEELPGVAGVVFLRYDYTSPYLRPNAIVGRQLNYPWYSWRLGLAAAAAARRGAYDVVHAQVLCALGYGWIRRRDQFLSQLPFIANPHGLEEYRTPDWRKWLAYAPFRTLYSYGTRCADRAIATDACTQGDLPRYLGVDPQRVVVIPSAIDVDECMVWTSGPIRAAMRARFELDRSDLTFLSVSRLERNKGYHILAQAFAKLRRRLPPRWRWLLVGEGKERAALEAQVRALGLAEHVTFAGKLTDTELHSLYEEIDLLVHPTLYEGSSLVTLEAMVHRKPVVASAAGGIPDKVFDGRNGFLACPGDADDLADKIARALDARQQWPAWGDESLRIVRTTFHWPVVARRTLDEYELMVAERTENRPTMNDER